MAMRFAVVVNVKAAREWGSILATGVGGDAERYKRFHFHGASGGWAGGRRVEMGHERPEAQA
jgi:hypothetical protein